jgi:hypothetical protein
MNHKSVHLLDLPDEILLIIMRKLDSMDVLYSLLGVNKRLDQMARNINNTQFLDFSSKLPNGKLYSFDRFRDEILPQIHHNVIALTFDFRSMERVLLACEYPNLSMIVIKSDILFPYRDLAGKEVFYYYHIMSIYFDHIIRRITNCSFIPRAD